MNKKFIGLSPHVAQNNTSNNFFRIIFSLLQPISHFLSFLITYQILGEFIAVKSHIFVLRIFLGTYSVLRSARDEQSKTGSDFSGQTILHVIFLWKSLVLVAVSGRIDLTSHCVQKKVKNGEGKIMA